MVIFLDKVDFRKDLKVIKLKWSLQANAFNSRQMFKNKYDFVDKQKIIASIRL